LRSERKKKKVKTIDLTRYFANPKWEKAMVQNNSDKRARFVKCAEGKGYVCPPDI
jgi:hypothetical protein